MVHIAKMTTLYPEFHGIGYYNFLVHEDREVVLNQVSDNSHDFTLEGLVKTRFKSIDALLAKYPTKDKLNDKFFNRAEDVQV